MSQENIDSSQNDSQLSILNLYDHLLEKIFLFTNFNDIKNLTLTCSKFHNVIGTSVQIMKNFEIDWYTDSKDEDYEQALLESNRRYQILVIEGINKKSQNLFKFITQQSSSLKHLEIYSSFLKLSDLIKIFKLVSKNLKIFALIDTIFEVDQDGPYDLENLQLDELKFGIGNDEFIKLYDLFQNILNLKKIIIHVYDINTREQQNVCNFIRNQNQMKEFEIIINDEQNNDGTTILKDLRNISSILQLTKLSITNSMEASNLYHIDTFVFLKQSFSSLKDLKISDTKFSASDFEVLLNMRLEELEIMYFRCLMTLPNTINVQNSSIKKLSVCHHLDKFENETQLLVEFLKNCLAVEYFKLHRIAMKYEIGLVLLYYMKNLKHLEY
ncbi:hypothetical protein PVAND_008075 [Polypedilum vanderplanki]|uniref:F-box domain-containing protein n=1 Tax=Polypedilum vanderplanki TaxID=319348 RepID=A0A9J6C9U7_POLVA|nr:hypothetical protein PVAND_008075 [Polypedilum vanderplanki]